MRYDLRKNVFQIHQVFRGVPRSNSNNGLILVLWTKTLGHKLFILQDDMGNKILKEVCLCLIIEYIKINNNISQKFDFTMTLLAKCNYCTAPYSDKIK